MRQGLIASALNHAMHRTFGKENQPPKKKNKQQESITIDNKGDLFDNPTGNGIRGTDPWGTGKYGASKDNGSRPHLGEDFISEINQDISSPSNGNAIFFEGKYSGVDIFLKNTNSGITKIRMLYVSRNNGYELGRSYPVEQGEAIGKAQSMLIYYKDASTMTNHIHLQIFHPNYGWVNPSSFFKK